MNTGVPICDLPGLNDQVDFFLRQYKPSAGNILIIGSGTAEIARVIQQHDKGKVVIIVDNNELLLQERLRASTLENVTVRMMDFHNTDFAGEFFDVVYAQASISTGYHTKIIREIYRILKTGAVFCLGEMYRTTEEIPPGISQVIESGGLRLLDKETIQSLYKAERLHISASKDLSYTLKKVYRFYSRNFNYGLHTLPESEKKLLKKEIARWKHEADTFAKMGGLKYIGYVTHFGIKKSANEEE